MPMELVFVIGMAVLLILCIKVKANAFISLLATALVMGMLSGMSGADTVSAITSGFAGTVKSIGIVIIFGIMLGNYLDAAKGTNRMAFDAVRLVGQKRAGLAMAITGYLVSIPVFSDAAFVILTPLVKAIHKKTKIPLAILAVSLSAGLLSTHVFVPPTPGPLAAAGLLAIGAMLAIVTLGKRLGNKAILDIMDKTLKDAGPIVFITAAGGALGQVLKVSGAGDSLAQMVLNTGLPFILIPFVISGLLKVVQGSGTVAVTTAATLCAPIAASLGLDPILIFLASGAGARLCCHVNDSYFWVYTNCMGFDMKTGLKTLSISNVVMSLGGLLATFICSLWL